MKSDYNYAILIQGLVCSAILLCIAGILRHQIYEVVHILSHQFSGGYDHHTHDVDHIQHDHEHELLEAAETAFEALPKPPITQSKQVKICSERIDLPIFTVSLSEILPSKEKNKIALFNLSLPVSSFLQIRTPPPRLCA